MLNFALNNKKDTEMRVILNGEHAGELQPRGLRELKAVLS